MFEEVLSHPIDPCLHFPLPPLLCLTVFKSVKPRLTASSVVFSPHLSVSVPPPSTFWSSALLHKFVPFSDKWFYRLIHLGSSNKLFFATNLLLEGMAFLFCPMNFLNTWHLFSLQQRLYYLLTPLVLSIKSLNFFYCNRIISHRKKKIFSGENAILRNQYLL